MSISLETNIFKKDMTRKFITLDNSLEPVRTCGETLHKMVSGLLARYFIQGCSPSMKPVRIRNLNISKKG